MFNIGGGELLVIALIALIVLGPARLPDAARQIGKTMGDLRRMSSGFQNEMKSALNTADDPTRVAARRNVLAKEAPAAGATGGDRVTTAIESVSTQPPGPARKKPLVAAKEAPVRPAPAKKKAPAAAKKATPAAKKKTASAVSKAAPRRTKT